jgi:hypothetical protein
LRSDQPLGRRADCEEQGAPHRGGRPNLRRAAIARIYGDDIRWTDDDGVIVGHAALDAKASDVQLQLGDLQFVPASPVYKTIGLGYLAFDLVAPGSDSPQVSGFDIALVRDEVIVDLYTVLTRPAT